MAAGISRLMILQKRQLIDPCGELKTRNSKLNTRRLRVQPGDDHSRNRLQVSEHIHHCQGRTARDQCLDLVVLSEAELEDEQTVGRETRRRLLDQAVDEVEALRTAKERNPRLELAHLRLLAITVDVMHIR